MTGARARIRSRRTGRRSRRCSRETPALEAKTLFELLSDEVPRSLRAGAAAHAPAARAALARDARARTGRCCFAQQHRPGRGRADGLHVDLRSSAITIAGQLFVHLLCVFVLPFSNWQWATVCLSESMAALRRACRRALFQLGRVPRYHQTDNSTAATHRIPTERRCSSTDGKRPFNDEYLALMRHFGMTPRTTAIGAKEQNGDVESEQRRAQAPARAGSAGARQPRLRERGGMAVLHRRGPCARPTPAADARRRRPRGDARARRREAAGVRRGGRHGQRVEHDAGEALRVLGAVAPHRRDAFACASTRTASRSTSATRCELACERLVGRNLHRIDYRHVIWSLVRKPGAFARYVYREEMFPSLVFRRPTTRSRRRSTAARATSSTCGSCIWRRARMRGRRRGRARRTSGRRRSRSPATP